MKLNPEPGQYVRPFHNRHVRYKVEQVEGDEMLVSHRYTYAGKEKVTSKWVANNSHLFSIVKGD